MDHPLEIQVKTVWMHAVTRSCGYSADLRDLAAGAADTATSTPSLLRHRPDCCLRLTPGPVPTADPDTGIPCVAGQCH